MIVNQLTEGWEVIFQRAHEMLAMQIAFCWKKSLRPERWPELLCAIAEHDNQQEGWSGKRHLTSAGAPKDFTFKGISLPHANRLTEVSQYKSRYVALLISMHSSFLYEPFRGRDKKTDRFLDEQLMLQRDLKKSLAISKKEATIAYNILQWHDRCSLILCKNLLPPDEHRLEVYDDPEGNKSSIWQRKDKSIGIDPWPFDEKEFKVWVEARTLTELGFENDAHLSDALMKSTVQEKVWLFRRDN